MKIAYLDTIGGIAGDMTLAAFVSAGVPLDDLVADLGKLSVHGFELSGRHVERHGITAVQVEVVVSGQQHHHRRLADICSMIDASDLSANVKEKSKSIFRILADAEAKIHNTTPEKIHFHEVGAVDAIIDIVGTCICFERLGIQQVYTSPVKLGSGGVTKAEHGALPVPSPAAVEILRDYPVILTSIGHELTTPTGAAIVKGLSAGVINDQLITVHAIGYGAGQREFEEFPNLLRIMIGEMASPEEVDELLLIETNIDDMNPQVYPYLIETLLTSGANDAHLTPVIMKKGRPGILLSVLAGADKLDSITSLIHAHTSTIGLRIQKVSRRKLPRRELSVETSFGRIKAKAVLRNGKEQLAAEFEDCRRIADERGIPLLEVLRIVEKELITSLSRG
jgi:hypothetical protein